jgi:hypothetical protein
LSAGTSPQCHQAGIVTTKRRKQRGGAPGGEVGVGLDAGSCRNKVLHPLRHHGERLTEGLRSVGDEVSEGLDPWLKVPFTCALSGRGE